MVLVSFDKQFIYTKTVKTAGTSVEYFFQRYCVPPEYGDRLGMRAELITDHGIVGLRGNARSTETRWYHHLSAAAVRRYLGEEIWRAYFKFCVVRNPFDKVVSKYFFSLSNEERDHLRTQDFAEVRRGFLASVHRRRLGIDRNAYVIDGEICMDYFIRYERLSEGVAEVCQRLGIARDVGELQRLKSHARFTDVHFSEFYDREAEEIVRRAYAFELAQFGYSLRD